MHLGEGGWDLLMDSSASLEKRGLRGGSAQLPDRREDPSPREQGRDKRERPQVAPGEV